jgi:ComF family protein
MRSSIFRFSNLLQVPEFSSSYTFLRSWAFFSGPLRNAIHRLKYKGDIALGEILARPLIEITNSLQLMIDAVVPVPIGIARKAERGYNQAAIIGLPVALGCGISYHPDWLVKIRETRSQVGLTRAERQVNLREAFRANGERAVGKRVLLVDDVVTSGATMEACSAALLEAGAVEIYGLTLARSGNPDYWMTEEKIFW